MDRWVPIFSKLVDSSVWDEAYHVRVLWTTMLALKDWDQVVRYNSYGLMKRANMKLEEVEDALKRLRAPDRKRPGQPHEGRRIEEVKDAGGFVGWRILNGKVYEDLMRRMKRRVYKAHWQADYREKAKGLSGGGAPPGYGTEQFLDGKGVSQEVLDANAAAVSEEMERNREDKP